MDAEKTLDSRLSFIPEDKREALLALLIRDVALAAAASTTESIDQKALQTYRENHPDLSKNGRKAKNIRKTAEYRQIAAELEERWRTEHPEEQQTPYDFSSIQEAVDYVRENAVKIDSDYNSEPWHLLEDIISSDSLSYFDGIAEEKTASVIDDLEGVFRSGDIDDFLYIEHYDNYYRQWPQIINIEIDDIERVVEQIDDGETIQRAWDSLWSGDFPSSDLSDMYWRSEHGSAFAELFDVLDYGIYDMDCVYDNAVDLEMGIWQSVEDRFPPEQIRKLLSESEAFAGAFFDEEEMEGAILDRIPDNPIDAYPLARTMSRRFVLHVGPTNSGKTHDAIAALGKAVSGVYLGPLRLLAFEQYEKLNEMGCLCSLRTGEEERKVEGAAHYASTIEMLDFGKRYEVAVIDEAQMMADPERGSRWTAAILGVAAAEVHVCMAPDALDLVKQLVELCGDGYEVVEHERFCPLEPLKQGFSFPGDVREGDAVIVFSRRTVHAVAAELAHRKKDPMKVSMIYGALPYDVRHAEAEKFASGQSQVVVATDAIGMGMNLPVKRVVFLEVSKYDGVSRRFLKSTEVKQIAGRAGRYGIHESGEFVAALENKKIRQLYGRKDEMLKTASLGFPQALLGVEGRLSAVMGKWAAMEVASPFEKTDSGHEIALAKTLEAMVAAGVSGAEGEDGLGTDASALAVKELVYKFATIPFKDNLEELTAMWKSMFCCEMAGEIYPVGKMVGLGLADNLQALEDEYARMDLLYQYCRVFGYADLLDSLTENRDAISKKMIEMLGRGGVFDARKCRECGKSLPWNWPYPMCDACHDRLYPPRWSRYDYWDDGDDDDYMYYR